MAETDLDLRADAADVQKQVHDKQIAFELATLRVLALAVGAVFMTRMVASFVLYSVGQALIASVVLAAGVLLCSGILLAQWRNELRPSLVRPLTILLGTLVTFNVFYILHTTGNLNQFFFSAMVLVAFGLASSTFMIWLTFVVPFLIIFAWCLFDLQVANVTPYIAILIGGLALSAVAFFVRMPTIRKLIELEVVHSHNARKLALSNQAKDQFLANMTHELRTPLTGVIGMIDLMEDTKLSAEQAHYLGTARKSAHYLLMVVNDILDIAKLEAGKLFLNSEPLDAVLLTKDITSIFDHRVRQKNITLSLDLPEQARIPVRGDNIRIGQILLNLLENALKFTENGRIDITLEVMKPGAEITLKWTVRDTGVGIADDRLHKLFDRFEQADSSSTRTTGGTGLGLAIIRDLVDLMKGRIGATSTVGEGSTFWFELTLPAVELMDLPDRSQSKGDRQFVSDNSRSAAAEAFGELRSPEPGDEPGLVRILYAEDNPVNRELVGRLIRREGWSGVAVVNGLEAVENVRENGNEYDLILMDIQMPVMDGLEAHKIIKQETRSSLPIVALTANTLPDDMRRYEEAGFDAIVGKPINVAELRAVVEKLVSPALQG